jgi:transcriptional regulator with XRE-family HTH domain
VEVTFGPNLKTARLSAGLTQTRLAEIVGVSQTTISLWELGETEPSIAKLRRLAFALNVTAAELVASEDAA